jgi:hypothetical protein
MRQPGILVRLAGTPLIACLLIAGAAMVIYGWYLGHTVWWLALAAVGFVFRTLSAVGAVRRYKAWVAQWEAMGRVGGTPPPVAKPNPWKRGMLMAAALIGLPVAFSQPAIQDNPALLSALEWGWGLLAIYCLLRVLAGLWRRAGSTARRRRQMRIEKSLDDPVTLAVAQASDNPTRASAERNLPDYCRQLMSRY